jgi:uracil-DNA glycosylase family 4
MTDRWEQLQKRIVHCERCPRLRKHCEQVAQEKRAAFRDWTYWGRPVPNLGDLQGRLLVVGLAPAAHGANRTGRMFTGDRSGDFLFAAMHKAGFASQAEARHADDGLELIDAVITAAAHCAPPGNKPTAAELETCCSTHLRDTFNLMPNLAVVVALGGIAFDRTVRLYREQGRLTNRPKPRFSHGELTRETGAPPILACYHPSQQNTFTGRLTFEMLVAVFERAGEIARQ